MHTRILMILSAAFTAVLGAVASFMPREILLYFGTPPEEHPMLLVQAAGALYLGFALLNWFARGVPIGGIYSRPVSAGNFVHFAIGAITLVKLLFTHRSALVVALAVPYTILAIWFALVIFTPAGRSPKSE